MKRFGYKQSNSDHTLFLRRQNNLTTCLIIFVDKMIKSDNIKEIEDLKRKLLCEFEMKDLGSL